MNKKLFVLAVLVVTGKSTQGAAGKFVSFCEGRPIKWCEAPSKGSASAVDVAMMSGKSPQERRSTVGKLKGPEATALAGAAIFVDREDREETLSFWTTRYELSTFGFTVALCGSLFGSVGIAALLARNHKLMPQSLAHTWNRSSYCYWGTMVTSVTLIANGLYSMLYLTRHSDDYAIPPVLTNADCKRNEGATYAEYGLLWLWKTRYEKWKLSSGRYSVTVKDGEGAPVLLVGESAIISHKTSQYSSTHCASSSTTSKSTPSGVTLDGQSTPSSSGDSIELSRCPQDTELQEGQYSSLYWPSSSGSSCSSSSSSTSSSSLESSRFSGSTSSSSSSENGEIYPRQSQSLSGVGIWQGYWFENRWYPIKTGGPESALWPSAQGVDNSPLELRAEGSETMIRVDGGELATSPLPQRPCKDETDGNEKEGGEAEDGEEVEV